MIIGAGLSGLSSAWHLKKKGLAPVVFEREAQVGGLCRSKHSKGFTFDYDGHLLHFRSSYALKLVKKLLNGNLAAHQRSAWISNFNIFSRYPFQANLYALPKPAANQCLREFIKARGAQVNSSQANFLKWINTTFGKGIARHFMVPYNKKFWRVPLDKMFCPWADKFIPQPDFSEVVNGFFTDSNNHFGYNSTFWYPIKGGIEQLSGAFEKQIKGISKNCCISEINLKNKEIIVNGKNKYKFDILILTIPLPELIKIIKPLPGKILSSLKKLRWNSIYNLNIGIEGNCQSGKHWIYFARKEVFFRCGFFHNFSNTITPKGKSSVYAEVSYSKNSPIDRRKIVRQVLNDLQKAKILNKKNKVLVLDVNDLKYGYPVYDRNYLQATNLIKGFLAQNNILTSGRYGNWQYMSMEDAILDGKRVAEEIMQ